MQVNFSKEWYERHARDEGDFPIIAGVMYDFSDVELTNTEETTEQE